MPRAYSTDPPAGGPGRPAGTYLLRRVKARVTPTPIIARPPAPPAIAYRRGDRVNQSRTALAASAQVQSETAPSDTDTRARISICSGTCPAARFTNWGRIAPNRMYDFGLVKPTTKPSQVARKLPRGAGVVASSTSARSLRCLMACTPSQIRYRAPASFTIKNAWPDRCRMEPRPTATATATP